MNEEDIDALLEEPPKKRTRAEERDAHCRDLCTWVAEGKSLQSFCGMFGRPTPRKVYKWLDADPLFAEEFATARAIGFEKLANECLEIADEGDEEDVKHRTLRINTRLKLLSHWNSERYGDKIQIGGDGKRPIKFSVEETEQRIVALLAVAKKRQLAAIEAKEASERDELLS